MIVGTGTDMIEIARIAESVSRYGDRFLHRIFTEAEIAYCMQKKTFAESLAARFAAKEAGAKALGTGISRGVSWQEIEVLRKAGQRPMLHLHGRAAQIARALGCEQAHLSITHTREFAMAFVVLDRINLSVTSAGH